MKHLFWLLLLVSGVASAQSTPTGSKTRWANGTYIGTKLDAYFNAADSNAVYWRADSVLMAKYKGAATELVMSRGTQTITGAKTFSAILTASSRLNVNGASDNASYGLSTLGGINAYEQSSSIGSSFSEYSNNATDDHQISIVRYRGTVASPTAVQSGDDIGGLVFGGYNGASVLGTARIQAMANQTFSSGNGGTYLIFGVADNGTSTLSYSTRLASSGSWNIGSNSDPSSGFNLQVTGKQRITSDLALGSSALSGGAAAQWVTTDGTGYSGGLITSIAGVAKSYYFSSAGYLNIQATTSEGIKLITNNSTTALTTESNGDVKIENLGTGTVYSNSGVLTNTNPSDSTLKDSIMPMRYGLAEVLKLKPKTFYYKSDSAHTVKYGFIAQEVKPIMPDVVRKLNPKDPKSKLGLETDGIYVTLVKAIQEQQAIIDDLKKRIIALENK